jgi:Replication initiator protein A
VRLCDWLFRAILRDGQVLDYASTYFQLGPIERRIYEVARSSCADGEPLDIDLSLLKLQTGFQNPLSNFRIAMRQIAAANAIPDYDIQLIEDAPGAAPAAGAPDMEEAPRKAGRRAAPARVVITRRAAAAIEAPPA